MCLIAFAYKVHPEYPLILLANRDEFYRRPTREAEFWISEGYPNLLAGKDLTGNGTWLGISKNGRWAALTNYRDMLQIKNGAPTRGTLVTDFLKGKASPQDYLKELKSKAQQFNGFNILVGNEFGIFHYSNISDVVTEVQSGIHGVSNALLDTPWPKLEFAKEELSKIVSENSLHPSALFRILQNKSTFPPHQLPQTGLPPNLEEAMSSVFISTEDYGTRCSTLLKINKNNHAELMERTYHPKDAANFHDTHFNFEIRTS